MYPIDQDAGAGRPAASLLRLMRFIGREERPVSVNAAAEHDCNCRRHAKRLRAPLATPLARNQGDGRWAAWVANGVDATGRRVLPICWQQPDAASLRPRGHVDVRRPAAAGERRVGGGMLYLGSLLVRASRAAPAMVGGVAWPFHVRRRGGRHGDALARFHLLMWSLRETNGELFEGVREVHLEAFVEMRSVPRAGWARH